MKRAEQRGRLLNGSSKSSLKPAGSGAKGATQGSFARRSSRAETESRLRQEKEYVESVFGFEKMEGSVPRLGWLLNYLPTVGLLYNPIILHFE